MVIFLGFIGKGLKKLSKIKPLKLLGQAASGITGISISTKGKQLPQVSTSATASPAAQQAAAGFTFAEQAYQTRRSAGAKPGPAIIGALGDTADLYSVGGGMEAFVQRNSGLLMLGIVGVVLILLLRKGR